MYLTENRAQSRLQMPFGFERGTHFSLLYEDPSNLLWVGLFAVERTGLLSFFLSRQETYRKIDNFAVNRQTTKISSSIDLLISGPSSLPRASGISCPLFWMESRLMRSPSCKLPVLFKLLTGKRSAAVTLFRVWSGGDLWKWRWSMACVYSS